MRNRHLPSCSAPKWLALVVSLTFFSQPVRADYAVQVGIYKMRTNAEEIVMALRDAGFPVETQPINRANGAVWARVIVGPYPQHELASQALARLRVAGYGGFVRGYQPVSTAARQPQTPKANGVTASPSDTMSSPAEIMEGAVAAPVQPRSPAGQVDESTAAPAAETPKVEDIFALDTINGSKPSARLSGFFRSAVAYTVSSPEHLSKFRNTLELAGQGRLTGNIAWKASGRIAYDAVFDLNDYYSTAVRDDQQLEKEVRETYLDVSAGDWDFRLGRQQIVWGEMIGLFFADVVSARDLREFVLPDFDFLRIPQWAVRSEYFKGNFHGEAIWIPYPTYDNIGVPGSEFYSYPIPPPPGYGEIIKGEHRPVGRLADSNYGLRLSYLIGDWDVSGFYYSSMDVSPTFFRTVVTAPSPVFVYTPDHTRIRQIGGTFSKDLGGAFLGGGEFGEEPIGAVLKGEIVYTRDRFFEVNRLSDVDGVVRQNTLDYIVGIDYSLPRSSRLNFQFFQRWYPDHDPDMIPQRLESGASIYASTQISDALEADLLWIGGFNRHDGLVRPKLQWTLNGHWRWLLGADLFNGPRDGLFGQYADKDRYYTELRFIF